jgi:hypothetical protein
MSIPKNREGIYFDEKEQFSAVRQKRRAAPVLNDRKEQTVKVKTKRV